MDGHRQPPRSRLGGFLEDHSRLVLTLILLLALATRLPWLATWWFNPDEGMIFSVASWARFSDFLRDLPTEPHPPLSYAIVRATLPLGDSLFVLRLPNLIASLFGIHALYLLTRELYDKRSALLAALFLAFATYAWTSSLLLRSYSIWLCFQIYALAFSVQWLRTHSRPTILLASLFWCLSLITHYFTLVYAPATALLLWRDQRRRAYPKNELRSILWATLPILILGLLLFQFHFRAALLENAGQQAAQQRALSDALGGSLSDLGLAFLSLFRPLIAPFGIFAACLLFLLGLTRSFTERKYPALLISGFPLVQGLLLAALGLYPLSGSRHNFPLAVLLLPPIAWALLAILRQPFSPRQLWPALPLLALLLLGSLWNWVPALYGSPQLPGYVLDQRIRSDTILNSTVFEKIREGGTLLLDHQSFFPLLPLFYQQRPPRDQVRGQDWSLTPYGKGRIIASGAFELRGEPINIHRPDHLLGFLESIDRDAPSLRIFETKDLYLVHAGWRGSVYEILRASKLLPTDPKFLLAEEHKGIFAWQQLAPQRYQSFMLTLEKLLPPPK